MKDFPIIIRNYNRGNYLVHTLNSILSTEYNGDIIILDDVSQDNQTKEFLYTNNKIYFNFNIHNLYSNYNINNKNKCKHQFRKLPIINCVNGLKNNNRIKVIQPDSKLGGARSSLIYAICYMFQNYKYQNILIGQQDVVFNKNWYNSLLDVYKKQNENYGIISNGTVQKFNFSNKKYINCNNSLLSSSLCWLISIKLYNIIKQHEIERLKWKPKEEYIDNGNNWKFYNIAGDAYLSHQISAKYGLNNYILKNGYVQHIGINSTSRLNYSGQYNLRWITNFVDDYQYSQVLSGNYTKFII